MSAFAKFPRFCRRRGACRRYRTCSIARSKARTIVTCSLPVGGLTATRRSGSAGRPRAASRAPQPPGGGAQTRALQRPLRVMRHQRIPAGQEGAAASFAKRTAWSIAVRAKWRRGVGRQARQKRGEFARIFEKLSPRKEYKPVLIPFRTPIAAISYSKKATQCDLRGLSDASGVR